MKPDRAADVERLFHEALERSPDQRQALLAAQCAGNDPLRAEVESLLAAYDRAEEFLEHPLAPLDSAVRSLTVAARDEASLDDEAAMIGRRVGPWRLTKRIGVGGMADVYLADRADGQYEQQAAIKLIRRGDRSLTVAARGDLVRRFWDERQHLANLDHPNIARLVDGGTTDEGLPYLAMEYIPGQPITAYCEEHHLSIKQRLDLFRHVCAAVQYAHSKFVAHRDLKPSNILVTGGAEGKGPPIPKLLDFGIAKLAKGDALPLDVAQRSAAPGGGPLFAPSAVEGSPRARIRNAPSQSRLVGLRPMTLEYASPEQVSGEEITTATDVYSLGVILYELMTGRLPYQVGPYDAKSVICEQRPPRPSSFKRSVGREVDTIVLKAMEKAPTRRYASATALAEDIERYLSGRPILARAPTFPYVAGKFLVRHASRVASIVFLAAAVAATTALLVTLSRQAILQASQTASLNRANRLYAIARNLEDLDRLAAAGDVLETAIAIERETPLDNPSVDAAKLTSLGRVLCKQQRFVEAEPILTEAMRKWRATTPKGGSVRLAETQRWLATCRIHQARYQEAEALLLESWPVLRERFGVANPQTQDTVKDLVVVSNALGKADQAREYQAMIEEIPDAPPTSRPVEAPP